MPLHTFLWHDYETFGAQVRRDRPAQFAAIRTDAELNEIGEPIMLYCRPAPDFLPDPQSCLITGITPQHCLEHGVPEHQTRNRGCSISACPCTRKTVSLPKSAGPSRVLFYIFRACSRQSAAASP